MIIKKIVERPFRKYAVKNFPEDARYIQHNTKGNEIYYSEKKQSYYEVTIKD